MQTKIKDLIDELQEKQIADFTEKVASRLTDNETIVNTLANETADLFEAHGFDEDDFEFLITFKQK